MNIIVDAMGGDNAPGAVVSGAVLAAEEMDINITLVGKQEVIEKELSSAGYGGDKITILNADEVILTEENPVEAIRRKKDSSMYIGLSHLANGGGDAFVSAGSTGALISGASLVVKRIKGVRRAALTPVIPHTDGHFLLVDAGATAECTADFLRQFAIMGSVYAEKVMGIEKPRVALVNIGTEEEKGTATIREANKMLKDTPINYTGYIEAREIPLGGADVVVCDGFTGNVILKFMEGMASAFSKKLKVIFLKNIGTKLAALLVKGGIKDFKKSMDYTEQGGAIVLGVKAPVVKAHGSSNPKAFCSAIRQAKKIVESGMVDTITKGIKEYCTEE